MDCSTILLWNIRFHICNTELRFRVAVGAGRGEVWGGSRKHREILSRTQAKDKRCSDSRRMKVAPKLEQSGTEGYGRTNTSETLASFSDTHGPGNAVRILMRAPAKSAVAHHQNPRLAHNELNLRHTAVVTAMVQLIPAVRSRDLQMCNLSCENSIFAMWSADRTLSQLAETYQSLG